MERINFESLPSTKTPLSPSTFNKLQDNIETNIYRFNITTAVSAGGQVTLPCFYKVGNDSLKVRYGSETLIKATNSDTEGHYYEVGSSGSISNKIKLTSDWNLAVGDILILEIQGVYS